MCHKALVLARQTEPATQNLDRYAFNFFGVDAGQWTMFQGGFLAHVCFMLGETLWLLKVRFLRFISEAGRAAILPLSICTTSIMNPSLVQLYICGYLEGFWCQRLSHWLPATAFHPHRAPAPSRIPSCL